MIRKPNLKSAETRLGKGGFQKIGPLKLITICRGYGMNLSFSQFKKLGSAWFIGLLCVSLAMPAYGRDSLTHDNRKAKQSNVWPVQGNDNIPEACRNYRPGISNFNFQQWYGDERGELSQLSNQRPKALNQAVRQTLERAAVAMAPELTAALLSLLTSRETRIYLGNYNSPPFRAQSHDGMDGLRVIFQRLMNGRLVTAIMSYGYNPKRRRMELNPGPDSIRVRVEDVRGPRVDPPRTAGLSFASEMNGLGNVTSFSPTVLFNPNGTRRSDSQPQAEPHNCIGCHSADRIKNGVFGQSFQNTDEYRELYPHFQSSTPTTWETAFNASLTGEFSPYQSFLRSLTQTNRLNIPRLNAANARETFTPPGLIDVLRRSCSSLFPSG